jgi:hypothetical protein
MVTSAPDLVSSRLASTIALLVRSFCLARPPSPGGFLLLSAAVAAIAAAFMKVISPHESVLA